MALDPFNKRTKQNHVGGKPLKYFRNMSIDSQELGTCVLEENLVHVGAGVLEQLVVGVEDDDGDLAVAQHAQLVRLLHQSELSFGERHLSVPLVRYTLDRDLFTAHLWFLSIKDIIC